MTGAEIDRLRALFLATPAIVGAFDAWAFVMIGRTLMVAVSNGAGFGAMCAICAHRHFAVFGTLCE